LDKKKQLQDLKIPDKAVLTLKYAKSFKYLFPNRQVFLLHEFNAGKPGQLFWRGYQETFSPLKPESDTSRRSSMEDEEEIRNNNNNNVRKREDDQNGKDEMKDSDEEILSHRNKIVKTVLEKMK